MLLTECRLQASGELFGFQSLLGFQITGEHVTMRASLVAQMVKNLSAVHEMWVPSLGQKDPLEKETATHSSILAWRIPWTVEPGRLQSRGSQSWTQPSDFTF